MGLILRTSSLANAGDSISVKGTALEYSEGDGNFMYLLSNMSGSIVKINGDTALTGSLNISTILNATTDTDRFLVSDAGIIKYRSGSQILADIAANLQNVTDTGATTTNIITVGGVTGSLFGTASWASRAVSSSYALTATSASYAQTASYVLNAISASYVLNAVSASYAPNLYNSNGTLLGNRTVNLSNYSLTFSGSSTIISGAFYLPNLTAANQSNIVTIDITTGQLYYTGSTTFVPVSSISASYVSGSSAIVTRLQVSGSAIITNELTLTGSLFISGSSNSAVINNGFVVLTQVSQSLNFANDAAATAGGVPLGGLYRNGNVIAIRIS
jgi:hypothetical protein